MIVISIDTLRADHLPAYGYAGVATPGIDALAADSAVFERCLAHTPQTLPSHATLFTGRLPPHTGVRYNLGFKLGADAKTLATLLKARGYRTAGFVSAWVLRRVRRVVGSEPELVYRGEIKPGQAIQIDHLDEVYGTTKRTSVRRRRRR